jgi:predicted nucleic acid-binding protein
MILVDTSAWIDFFRGEETSVRRTLHSLIDGEEDLCLTGIILTEILQGIRDDKMSSDIQEYLLAFPFYHPRDVSTYVHAADIFKSCARKGRTVRKTVDCLIAAVAIEHDLTLIHNDRDFASIAACTGLKILEVT